jgi:hypothetical protein
MSLNCTRCNPEAESQTFDARKRNRAFEALENAFEVVRHQADALILTPTNATEAPVLTLTSISFRRPYFMALDMMFETTWSRRSRS